jgi:hypothetical protein
MCNQPSASPSRLLTVAAYGSPLSRWKVIIKPRMSQRRRLTEGFVGFVVSRTVLLLLMIRLKLGSISTAPWASPSRPFLSHQPSNADLANASQTLRTGVRPRHLSFAITGSTMDL